MKTLKVFEHHAIKANEELNFYYGKTIKKEKLDGRYIEALWRFYEAQKIEFFKPIHNGVCFKEYVGVVKVLDLTIEILPKADNQLVNVDNSVAVENKWQNILIDMLRVCHLIDTPSISDANLRHRSNSILDLYIERFINEVNSLIRQGLIRRYRRIERNSNSLKGKLLISKNIEKNLVHQERFYVSQTEYDKNHLLHQILHQAIRILPGLCNSQTLISECCRLELSFPEVDNIKVSEALFEKINYDRKSEPYQRAIQIAKLLLLNYRPDLIAGSYNSIAILFNMNQLWEEYIYRMLLKAKPKGVEIYNQKSIRFWQSGLNVRTIRPDIIIKSPIGKIVIDTKWKNLHNNLSKISMDDLRQMYTYHDYFEANDCYLIYPGDELSVLNGTFNDRYFFSNIKQTRKHCGVILGRAWINEISGRSFLDKSLGNQIFDSLFKQ